MADSLEKFTSSFQPRDICRAFMSAKSDRQCVMDGSLNLKARLNNLHAVRYAYVTYALMSPEVLI